MTNFLSGLTIDVAIVNVIVGAPYALPPLILSLAFVVIALTIWGDAS